MPSAPKPTSSQAALAARLAGFFRHDADPWDRLQVPLPPQVFGLASTREFSRYLDGVLKSQVGSVEDLCAWLKGCETVDDASLFVEADYWQHPVTFEQVRKGDCEDHALWAWRQLRGLGYAAHFVAGLWNGLPHAWVMWSDGLGEHLLEGTAKSDPMIRPVADIRASGDYLPALGVDDRLRTYVYQGYPAFLAARGRSPIAAFPPSAGEVAILAGGRSSRMGRDKAKIRVGGRSLLAHVRAAADALGWPVRVIRRDQVPSCGPVGGILTALARARPGCPAVLVLSCDMPAIEPELLRRMLRRFGSRTRCLFLEDEGRIGFPVLLAPGALEDIRGFHARCGRSIHALCEALRGRRLPALARERPFLINVNTPGDLEAFRQIFRQSRPSPTADRGSSPQPARG